ncbi:hypothetical protein L6452_44721 [Arctium lappa]|nr:hypothetical protein L6452_44721 [Arctium lappa]
MIIGVVRTEGGDTCWEMERETCRRDGRKDQLSTGSIGEGEEDRGIWMRHVKVKDKGKYGINMLLLCQLNQHATVLSIESSTVLSIFWFNMHYQVIPS